MKRITTLLFAAIVAGHAQTPPSLVDQTVAKTFEEFTKLKSNELAVTLVTLPKDKPAAYASYRGAEPIYPASVVKLFYLVAAHRWRMAASRTRRNCAAPCAT
jgi:hypothetical protein